MTTFQQGTPFSVEEVLELYRSCDWSAANKPVQLMAGLEGAHCVISAWEGKRLVGLVSALSDGALVVYFPHLLVHPEFQSRGIGTELLSQIRARYRGYHQQVLLAYDHAAGFYERAGFTRAAGIIPFWTYHPGTSTGDES